MVITGGNAVIDKETNQEIFHRKCAIIFGARDVKKDEDFMADIKADKKLKAEIN
jgi:hypothetical protein